MPEFRTVHRGADVVLLAPILKFEKQDDGSLLVEGVATSEAIDADNEVMDYNAAKPAFKRWRGNIREQHDPHKAVGHAIEVNPDDATKMIGLRAFVSAGAPDTQAKVMDGTLSYFSLSGRKASMKLEKVGQQNVKRIFLDRLTEVSLVDSGSNPDTAFAVVKMEGDVPVMAEVEEKGDVPGHEFHGNQHTGAGKTSDQREANKNARTETKLADKQGAEAERLSTLAARGNIPHSDAATANRGAAEAHTRAALAHAEAAKNYEPGSKQRALHEEMSARHTGQAELHSHREQFHSRPNAGAAFNQGRVPAGKHWWSRADVVADVEKKDKDPNVGGGVDRDKIPAEDFAGKDRSYPIVKPGDVSDAASSIGRAGPNNYSSDKLKENIIRIAQRKGKAFVAELPESWKDGKDKTMKIDAQKIAKRFVQLAKAKGYELTEPDADVCKIGFGSDIAPVYGGINSPTPETTHALQGVYIVAMIEQVLMEEVAEPESGDPDELEQHAKLLQARSLVEEFVSAELAEHAEVSPQDLQVEAGHVSAADAVVDVTKQDDKKVKCPECEAMVVPDEDDECPECGADLSGETEDADVNADTTKATTKDMITKGNCQKVHDHCVKEFGSKCMKEASFTDDEVEKARKAGVLNMVTKENHQGIHDHCVKCGAKCMKSDKADEVAEVVKQDDTPPETVVTPDTTVPPVVEKEVKDQPSPEELVKSLSEKLATLEAQVTTLTGSLTEKAQEEEKRNKEISDLKAKIEAYGKRMVPPGREVVKMAENAASLSTLDQFGKALHDVGGDSASVAAAAALIKIAQDKRGR